MALDGEPTMVNHQGEADQGAVGPLFLRVPPFGQRIACSGSFQIGIGQVVEKDQAIGRKVLLRFLEESSFERVLDRPQAVSDLVDSVFAHRLDLVAQDFSDGGLSGHPAMGMELASRRDETANDDGLCQCPLLGGKAGDDQNFVDSQPFPGLMSDQFRPQAPQLRGLNALGREHGGSRRFGRGFSSGDRPVFRPVGADRLLHHRQDLRLWRKEGLPVFQAVFKGLPRALKEDSGRVSLPR
jgi:hypothetical protein